MQGVIKEAESRTKRQSLLKLDDDKRAVKKKVALGIGVIMLVATFVMMNVTLLQAFQEDPLSHHENGWMGPLLKERIGRIGMRKKEVKAEAREGSEAPKAPEASTSLMPEEDVDEGHVEDEVLEGEVEIPAPMLEDHHHTRKPTTPPVDSDPGVKTMEAKPAESAASNAEAAAADEAPQGLPGLPKGSGSSDAE